MSRSSRWKLEKTKVKVVFRLQCHATHIPQTGWNNLFVSIIPADTGKATAKTNKAAVRNGTCKWSDPIYETARLLQDAKTKNFEEKLYKLVVAMGTSRSSILGEASINLSDYVDALKPTNIALPLHGSDSGAILNVTVQLLTSKTGFREFEQQREVTDRGLPITTDLDSGQISSPGDSPISRGDKVNHRVRFRPEPKELASLEKETGFSDGYSDSAVGFNGSSNTSESLYAEKHETSSTCEMDSVKSPISSEVEEVSPPRPKPEKGTLEWVHHLGTEIPMDSEVANVYEENRRLRRALEAADQSMSELKREVISLQACADDIAVETQKVTEQLTHEIASDKELAKEVSLLRSDCLRFKDELEWLRNLKMNPSVTVPKQDSSVKWLKGLSVVEDKIREVQNKVQLQDLEALLCVLQDLKQETVLSATNRKAGELGLPKIDHIMSDTGLGAELCLPEGVLLPGLSADPTSAMQGEMFKLLRELDESKSGRDNLVRKMDEMECYYEALIQELEENQKQILGELQNLRNEHSTCVYAISSTNAQMEAMHRQMSDELLVLAEERCNLDALNKDLEKRVVSSEAALKRARLNYSISVNQLQKDLEMLSLQVVSMYETNANLIKKVFSEASPTLLEGCQEDVLRDLDAEDPDAGKLMISRDLNMVAKCQPSGGDRLYKRVQEELSEMHLLNVHLDVLSLMLRQSLLETDADNRLAKEKMCEFAKQLELSSDCNESLKLKLQNVMGDLCVLNEEKAISVVRCNELALLNRTLEANLNALSEENRSLCKEIKEEKGTYVQRCNDLGFQNQTLKANLNALSEEKRVFCEKISEEKSICVQRCNDLDFQNQTSEGNLKSLSEEKRIVCEKMAEENSICVQRCNDLEFQNQTLEANLNVLSEEKRILSEKITEVETLVTEYRRCKSEHENCDAEKANLTILLEQAAAENEHLTDEISLSQEDLKSMKSKVIELSLSKESLEKAIDYVRERLESFVSFGGEQEFSLPPSGILEDNNSVFGIFRTIMLSLEGVHQNFYHKTRQLMEEKKTLENERDAAKLSVASAKSEADSVKQKFHCDLPDIVCKLSMSCTLVEKLQTDLESVSNRLKDSSEAEENYARKTQDLLADFAKMEALLQELTSKNNDLADEIAALGSVTNDLEGNKLMMDKITQENLELVASLQKKTRESDVLALELDDFRETLRTLENHEAEISHLKQRLSEVDTEKGRVSNQLSHLEEQLKKTVEESSNLELELRDMHALLMAGDITHAVFVKQYECHVEGILRQLECSNQCIQEVSTENDNLATKLARYAEEKTKLLSTLECSESNVSLNKVLEHSNGMLASEIEEFKLRCALLEGIFDKAKTEHELEIDELKRLLGGCQNEIEVLIFSKEDIEIRSLVLEAKVIDMIAQNNFQEEHQEELTRQLSEQILKAEEFKNLSIHLKELKDKAEAEHHERRESEGSSNAMQESLRIAFIKEQYENKLQEVRQELSISKKHSEDMLWKLQDALDELENKKKSEVSLLKKNEQLIQKIAELEGELQLVLSDSRERFMAYDQLKAELECSKMSLDCCKEEKQQLLVSLEDCKDEKSRLADEIELMKKQLEDLREAFTRIPENTEDECQIVQRGLNEPLSSKQLLKMSVQSTSCSEIETASEEVDYLGDNIPAKPERENGNADLVKEGEMNEQVLQGASDGKATEESSELANGESNDDEQLALLKDQLKTQTLLSSLDRLHKELEKMRSENTFQEDNDDSSELNCDGLQREQMHLEKVSEELGNMSSLYKDSSRSGNSIERVLALELELAEALQAKAKKRSSLQFQSSFLKLHNDEAAVFQSFRDINELIKDMVEMKGRHSSMEAELREMHQRYSKLSLHLAEVEGERGKLSMTLKSVRSSKRLFNRSTSSTNDEPSP